MDMVLIGGLWLTADVWESVVEELGKRGHRGIAVSLPGQGDDDAAATLEDQLEAVTSAVTSVDRPLVVGHSAAASLAWMAADRVSDQVAGVVFVGDSPRLMERRTPISLSPKTGGCGSRAGRSLKGLIQRTCRHSRSV